MYRLVPLLALLLIGCPEPQDDARWTVLADDLGGVLLSAGGPSIDEAWAVGGPLGSAGEALMLRREGDGWARVETGFTDTLWWVWVAGPDEVFAVGENGRVVRWSAGTLETMDTPTDAVLFGVWGSSPTDVWAVGGDPFAEGETDVILHYTGGAWEAVPSPMPAGVALFKVWGRAADDVWVVGQAGVILHYDGAWEAVESPTEAPLFTVAGNSAGEVWAVGGPPGVALRFDGGGWVTAELPGPASVLNGVDVGEDGSVLIVGSNGTKFFRGADEQWLDEFDAPPGADLHAAWIGGDHALAVGGNFNSPRGAARRGVLAYRGAAPPAAP